MINEMVKKPDPAPLFEAIDRLGGNRAKAVMVGDSPFDIDAAKNAGIPWHMGMQCARHHQGRGL